MIVGAAQRSITPEIGVPLVGWSVRAAGDLLARRVHDELFAKALAVEGPGGAWILVVADVVGVDAVATELIRAGVSEATGLPTAAVLVSATHTHSGPALSAIACAVAPSALGTVRPDGSVLPSHGQPVDRFDGAALHENDVDEAWRGDFVAATVAAARTAWDQREQAEVCFGEAPVADVASSRRVLLSDGSWADPRRPWPGGATVVHRSAIDPIVRAAFFRRSADRTPLTALVNYASHPWVFSTAGISAELPGVVAAEFGRTWSDPGNDPPTVLYLTGALGDATPLWNIDIERVWSARGDLDPAADLARREQGFDEELTRLGGLLAAGARQALAKAGAWHGSPRVRARRRVFTLPLKEGYTRHASIRLADWQMEAPPGEHLTEIQLLQLGPAGVLGLPGEPFAALGRAIRAGASLAPLLVAALANDYGVTYLAPDDEYALGGYEQTVTPAGPGAGERLVMEAKELLASFDASGAPARRAAS